MGKKCDPENLKKRFKKKGKKPKKDEEKEGYTKR